MNTGILKPAAPVLERLFAVLDLILVLFAMLMCHRIYFNQFATIPERMLIMLFTLCAVYVVFSLSGLYQSKRSVPLASELTQVCYSLSVVVLSTGLFAFLSKIAIDVSRLWYGLSMVLALLFLCGLRVCVRLMLRSLRQRGFNFRRIVVLAEDADWRTWAKKFAEDKSSGLKLTGYFSLPAGTQGSLHATGVNVAADVQRLSPDHPDSLSGGDAVGPDPVVDNPRSGVENVDEQLTRAELHANTDIASFVERCRRREAPIDQVWIALPLHHENVIKAVRSSLDDSSVDICYVPDQFTLSMVHGRIGTASGISIVDLSDQSLTTIGEVIKNIFDSVVAFVLIVLLAPLMLAIALAIKLTSKGPVLFTQKRYGIDGTLIHVHKFRSMYLHAENTGEVKQARRHDSRITPLGRFLRASSLDELPQLFNVLSGSMSLVGPRPHAVEHNEQYRRKIERYMQRHRIKPGITGLAQINGFRGETDTLDKMQRRIDYDLEYIRSWSLWLDIKILAKTLVSGFWHKNAY